MKKLFKFLLILFVLMPFSVKADMGAPMVGGYQITPASVDGAKYYDDGKAVGTIEYGTKVKVVYEYLEDNDDEKWVTIEVVGKDYYYEVRLSDFILVKDVYAPNVNDGFTYKLTPSGDALVLDVNGVDIYNGPSYAYKKSGVHIPAGTTVKATYGHGEDASVWYYIEYNGSKGWICALNAAVGFKVKDLENPLIMGLETTIYDSVKDNANLIGKIPAFEKIYEYYEVDPWSWSYYVNYGNVSGFINSNSDLWLYDEDTELKYISDKSFKIYEYGDIDSKEIGELKSLTEFNMLGEIGHNAYLYYVKVGKITGFIEIPDEGCRFVDETDQYYNQLLKGTLTFDAYEDLVDDDYFEEEEQPIEPGEEELTPDDENQENDETDKEVDPDKETDDKKMKASDYVIICVSAGVVLALTGVVIIILVNKKKKGSKEDVKTQEVEEKIIDNTEEVKSFNEEVDNKEDIN